MELVIPDLTDVLIAIGVDVGPLSMALVILELTDVLAAAGVGNRPKAVVLQTRFRTRR